MARALFMIALFASFMVMRATPTYAWLKYINIAADGSFFAISCGSSAGPTAIVYDAQLNQTFVVGVAQPSQCASGGPGSGPAPVESTQ